MLFNSFEQGAIDPTPISDINVNFSMDGSRIQNQQIDASSDYEVGDWIVVKYDGNEYPGEITDVFSNEVAVSTMQRAGKFFKWPEKRDEILYLFENIVSKIDPPIAKGRRRQWSFNYFN